MGGVPGYYFFVVWCDGMLICGRHTKFLNAIIFSLESFVFWLMTCYDDRVGPRPCKSWTRVPRYILDLLCHKMFISTDDSLTFLLCLALCSCLSLVDFIYGMLYYGRGGVVKKKKNEE